MTEYIVDTFELCKIGGDDCVLYDLYHHRFLDGGPACIKFPDKFMVKIRMMPLNDEPGLEYFNIGETNPFLTMDIGDACFTAIASLLKVVGTQAMLFSLSRGEELETELQGHRSASEHHICFPEHFIVSIDLDAEDDTNGIKYFDLDMKQFLCMGHSDTGFYTTVALLKSVGKQLD